MLLLQAQLSRTNDPAASAIWEGCRNTYQTASSWISSSDPAAHLDHFRFESLADRHYAVTDLIAAARAQAWMYPRGSYGLVEDAIQAA